MNAICKIKRISPSSMILKEDKLSVFEISYVCNVVAKLYAELLCPGVKLLGEGTIETNNRVLIGEVSSSGKKRWPVIIGNHGNFDGVCILRFSLSCNNTSTFDYNVTIKS